MHRIADEEDLRYMSYMLKIQQILSEAAKTSRVFCCNLLLCSLKNEASGQIRFFSEKMFTVEKSIGGIMAHLQLRGCLLLPV